MDPHGGTMPLETRFTGNTRRTTTPTTDRGSARIGHRSSSDDEISSRIRASTSALPSYCLEQLPAPQDISDDRVIRDQSNEANDLLNPSNTSYLAAARSGTKQTSLEETHPAPGAHKDSKLPPLSPPRVSAAAKDDEEYHPSPFSSSYVSGIGPQDEDGADLLQLLTLQEVEVNPEPSKVPLAFGSIHPPDQEARTPSSNQIPADLDQNSLASDGAAYFDDDELEEIQRLPTLSTQLLIRHTLEALTEDVLEAMVRSNRYQTLFLNHVMPMAHAHALLNPVDFEEDDDDDAIPALSREPSHTSAVLALERFEEALGMNISITHVHMNACHPKVMETTLWGLSCMPSRLSHLSVAIWPLADPHRANYLIWDGLVEILTNTQTLRSLHIASHFDEDDATAMNWALLARGIQQNRSLQFVSLETVQWTKEGMDLLTSALSQHPHLAQAPLLRDRENPSRVTVERPPIRTTTTTVSTTAASSTSVPFEDSTNSVRRAKLVKVVSEDTVKFDRTSHAPSSSPPSWVG